MRRQICLRLTIAVLTAGSVLVPLFAAQDPPRTIFSSHSEAVVVHVTVLDGKSKLVSGLPREAFTVYEDGRPQTLTFFENADHPVTVGLVLDCSGSMQRKRNAIIAAGLAFSQSSRPDDELFTVNFNEQVWSGLPPALPFTTDYEQLQRALQRTSARGETALFDALRTGLDHLGLGHEQKKVLIVVSDGGDNASRTTFDQVLDRALHMDALIYTLGLHDEYDDDADPDLLRKLAKATGGEAYFPRNPDGATKILERIAHDIRSGYTLGYVPSGPKDGYHAIRVEVHAPGGHKLNVRARSGYVAGTQTASHDRN